MKKPIISLVATISLVTTQVLAFEISDFDFRARQLGFLPYYSLPAEQKIVVAILDDEGYAGYETELGKTIPVSTILYEGSNSAGVFGGNHGLRMAQIVSAYMTNNFANPELAPDLVLYYASGYANFRAAVSDAVVRGVDVILSSQAHSRFGNFDGAGFYNDIVNQATEAGIVWINAAGNFRGNSYGARLIRSGNEPDYVQLIQRNNYSNPFPNQQVQQMSNAQVQNAQMQNPYIPQRTQQQRAGKYNGENLVEMHCNPPTLPKEARNTVSENRVCNFRLTLNWGAYRDQTNIGTDLDLDLELYNEIYDEKKGNRNTPEIEAYRSQTSNPKLFKATEKTSAEYTPYPYEIIEDTVPAGVYYVKVRIANTDNTLINENMGFRISVSGEGTSLSPENQDENLMVIADNPSVITVGAADGNRSSISRNLNKPEVVAPSKIVFIDEEIGNSGYAGSSNAAAVVAAGVALMKQLLPETDDNRILNKETIVQSFRVASNSVIPRSELTVADLGFAPLHDGECFMDAGPVNAPPYIQQFITQTRGKIVLTNDGLKIVVPVPLEMIAKQEAHLIEKGHNKLLLGSFLVPNQMGQPVPQVQMRVFAPYEYTQLNAVPNSVFEIFQLPQDGDLCMTPPDWRVPRTGGDFYANRAFYLPRPQEMVLSLAPLAVGYRQR